ncbi:MAG: 3-oxoacyl-ACP synthase III [Planctomycetaceae bacterium]|jgi:3-oxoacyl-[acyl-carrier-protein] synthase-3
MRYRHVALEALAAVVPDEVVSSAEIETRLAPVYQRLGLPEGRLELMTGIRERRFWPQGTRPGEISVQTCEKLLAQSGFDRRAIGALVHGSVCRDQLEPATAARVHQALGLPQSALVLDVSNACLGLLNGLLLVANMIELGQIRAGLVVGTEVGRDLVEATIDSLLARPTVTRQDVKLAFASLTIGSGSAALLLTDRRLSRGGHRLLGGAFQADTAAHQLCAGGFAEQTDDQNRPLMQTDSEGLLRAGVELAGATFGEFLDRVGWSAGDVQRVCTHQVGRAHRRLLFDRLGLDAALDYSTVEWLGNTGAAALPLTAALGAEAGHVRPGDRVAWLGIGSGLNSLMLGLDW